MRPPGPDPVTDDKSTPCSRAMLRASGDVSSGAAVDADGTSGGPASGLTGGWPDVGVTSAAGGGDTVVAAGGVVGWTSAAVPITAIGVPMGTVVPSGTSTWASTPDSYASSSMTALSVSISARTSPLPTGSPSCLTHRLRMPSSMVSDRRGMITSGMAGLLAGEAGSVEGFADDPGQRGGVREGG